MNINLYTWFGERELNFMPVHFVKTNTPLREEAYSWILENLNGRFYLLDKTFADLTLFGEVYPCFEDPQEATFYELTWS